MRTPSWAAGLDHCLVTRTRSAATELRGAIARFDRREPISRRPSFHASKSATRFWSVSWVNLRQSTDMLRALRPASNANPTFSWVRLAQRVPVRVAIEGSRLNKSAWSPDGRRPSASVPLRGEWTARRAIGHRVTRWGGLSPATPRLAACGRAALLDLSVNSRKSIAFHCRSRALRRCKRRPDHEALGRFNFIDCQRRVRRA